MTPALALIALASAISAQALLARHARLPVAVGLYAGAGLLFAAAFVRQRPALFESVQALTSPRRLLLALALPCALNGAALGLFATEAAPNVAWLLFLASLLALLFVSWRTVRVCSQPQEASARGGWLHRWAGAGKRREVAGRLLAAAGALGVMGLAAGLRFFRFHSLPEGVWFDEAEYGLLVRRMLGDSDFRPIYAPSGNVSAMFLYGIGLSFRLFGESIESLRLVSALAGVATVGVFYFLARWYASRPAALAASVLLAVSYWHVNFSRIGLQGVLTPLFTALALLFLLRAWRAGRALDFAVAGIAVSGGVWAYTASNALPIVALGFFLACALVDRSWLRARATGLVLFAVAALIAVSPLAYYAATHRHEYFARVNQTNIFRDRSFSESMRVLGENTEKHLLMFNYEGDRNGRHNLPGRRMLDDVTGVLAVLGLSYCLARPRRPEYLLPVGTLAMGLLGGVLTLDYEAPQSLRAIMALPVAYLMAGIAVDAGWRLVTAPGRLRLTRTCLAAVAVASLLAWAGVMNYGVFFDKKANDLASWAAYSTDVTLVAKEIHGHTGGYDVSVAPVFVGQPTLGFLAPDLDSFTQLNASTALPLRSTGEKGAAFLVDVGSAQMVPQAKSYYPGAEVKALAPPFDREHPVGWVVYVPAEDIRAVQGLEGRYYVGGESTSSPAFMRRDAAVDFDWARSAPLEPPFSVHWEGCVYAPDRGRYSFGLEGALASPDIQVDSLPLDFASGGLSSPVMLAQGLHRIEVAATFEKLGSCRLVWDASGEVEPVPATCLFAPALAPHGLLGRYYDNSDWSGEPALERVDSEISFYFQVTPLPRPYTVEWSGKILAPVSGPYYFSVYAVGAAQLFIDARRVASCDGGESGGSASLEEGEHDVVVRFVDDRGYSGVKLFWTPPGGQKEIIPSTNLVPWGDGG